MSYFQNKNSNLRIAIMPFRLWQHRQKGASLIVSLLMLVVVLLLGISAAQMALMGEKSSRNDRDRQTAFQAAEAALKDAELDIRSSPDATKSRSAGFLEAPDNDVSVFLDFAAGCGAGESNTSLGLCAPSDPGVTPVWQTVDLTDVDTSSTRAVPYGKFTGQTMPIGKGSLSSKLPRYIIERLTFNRAGQSAELGNVVFLYRITAIGFGTRDTTQVVLQSYYHKERPH